MLLYERLNEGRAKNQDLQGMLKSVADESAPQEKARLLDQVKQDNLETSGMERKITELKDEIQTIGEGMSQLEGEDPHAGYS